MGLADRHQALDLDQSLRPGLDLLANEIVIALKKRTRFPRNPEIYRPGLVRTAPGETLLDYELARIEHLHAELGRYTFASQEAFTEVSDVEPIILREHPPSPIASMASGVAARVKAFYLGWVERGCGTGSDPNTYGETVITDVEALLCILERVNLGKFVAESKLAELGGSLPGSGRRCRGDQGAAGAQGPRSAGLRARAAPRLSLRARCRSGHRGLRVDDRDHHRHRGGLHPDALRELTGRGSPPRCGLTPQPPSRSPGLSRPQSHLLHAPRHFQGCRWPGDIGGEEPVPRLGHFQPPLNNCPRMAKVG